MNKSLPVARNTTCCFQFKVSSRVLSRAVGFSWYLVLLLLALGSDVRASDDFESPDYRSSLQAIRTILAPVTGIAEVSDEYKRVHLGLAVKVADVKGEKARRQQNDLKLMASRLSEKKRPNIIMNGRKFDQVQRVECVDDDFYNLLMADLGTIRPEKIIDDYGTYFDNEHGKAISAIVDTPDRKATDGNSNDVESYLSWSSNNLKSNGSLLMVDEVVKFMNMTQKTYAQMESKLEKFKLREKFASSASSQIKRDNNIKLSDIPSHQEILKMEKYRLKQLEEAKMHLLRGEEALIVVNNKVKKLKEAVGEKELQDALCYCIAHRSGRLALELVMELFVDKDTGKSINNLLLAQKKAKAVAKDVAEFCAYWYGDTLRSQAIQKEKQIKRLVLKAIQVDAIESRKFENKTTMKTIVDETTITGPNGTTTIRHKHMEVVSSIVEMTSMWLPSLAGWIREQISLSSSRKKTKKHHKSSRKIVKIIEKEVPEDEFSSISSTTTGAPTTSQPSSDSPSTTSTPTSAQTSSTTTTTTSPSTSSKPKMRKLSKGKKRDTRSLADRDEILFTSPFDSELNYADVDDPSELENSEIVKSFIAHAYPMNQPRLRARRSIDNQKKRKIMRQTKRRLAPNRSVKLHLIPKKLAAGPLGAGEKPTVASEVITTTKIPQTQSLSPTDSWHLEVDPNSGQITKTMLIPTYEMVKVPVNAPIETAFERRVSIRASKCAKGGAMQLLNAAIQLSNIGFYPSYVKPNGTFVETIKKTFVLAFARQWIIQRNKWSKRLDKKSKKGDKWSSSRAGESDKQEEANLSVDEEIDSELEPTRSAYERGVRLGYSLGKFIGDKASRQWPDPAELNTFTYDSLFLAGVGDGYSEEDSRQLERRIVAESAKRVAYTEANRKAFAKTLQSAYLNGAFLVPRWGVLHAQRSVMKRSAKEGSRVGFAAASAAAQEFAPKAMKFFNIHKHQRALARPYKTKVGHLSDSWAGVSERINEVALESAVNRNVSLAAVDCGQKSGALMGALVGLIVVPEAFETYARFRGSLEAFESQFNEYKLGAMRGYELGESWAYLNYTYQLQRNLNSMKLQMRSDSPKRSSHGKRITRQAADQQPEGSRRSQSNSPVEMSVDSSSSKRIMSLEKEFSSSSLFESTPRDELTNVDNIFQYMVLNYGGQLVTNHSRRHMLKVRALTSVDENLISDLKHQSADLVPKPMEANQDHLTDDLAARGANNKAGELKGIINVPQKGDKRYEIKIDISDLSPMVRFLDDVLDKKQREQNFASILPEASKIFMKLKISRKPKALTHSQDSQWSASDDVTKYLNADQFDSSDGYLTGTYDKIYSQIRDLDPQKIPPLGDEEIKLLDELYKKIEASEVDSSPVLATKKILKVSTIAPERIESIGEQKDTTKAPTVGKKRPTPVMELNTQQTSTHSPETTTTTTTPVPTTTTTTSAITTTSSPEMITEGPISLTSTTSTPTQINDPKEATTTDAPDTGAKGNSRSDLDVSITHDDWDDLD